MLNLPGKIEWTGMEKLILTAYTTMANVFVKKCTRIYTGGKGFQSIGGGDDDDVDDNNGSNK